MKEDIDSCDDCHDEDCEECGLTPCCCDIEDDECEEKKSERSDSKESNTSDTNHQIYRSQMVGTINAQIQPNSVQAGLTANANRSGAVITNIGTSILLIRVHPSNLDPTKAGSTGILSTLYPNQSYTMDTNTPRRITQSNICVVNTDTTIVGAYSISETISKS
jgi:hypothetical protein